MPYDLLAKAGYPVEGNAPIGGKRARTAPVAMRQGEIGPDRKRYCSGLAVLNTHRVG